MNVIDEIKAARKSLLTEEQKSKVLDCVKAQLVSNDYALIEGAEHYAVYGGHHKWRFPKTEKEKGWHWSLEAPFPLHHAIAEWLRSLGFRCQRWYNGGGVDQGMMITI